MDNNQEIFISSSTLESIDLAMYNWLDKKMNLYTETNKGWKKTPIIWVSGERSWQTKNKIDLKNSNNNFIFPVISLERTEINKELDKKGKFWADIRPINDIQGGSVIVNTTIKQNKTSNFANTESNKKVKQPNFKRKNEKIVYEVSMIPLPVYATIKYIIDIKTEYQQQMNDLVHQFITFPGGVNYFIIEHEGNRYEAFIEGNLSLKNNVAELQESERLFNTQISIRVLGYLLGGDKNNNKPKISKRENIVEVKIPREYIILDEYEDKIKKY